MSRQTVRSAVADWIDGRVDGINKVYAAPPKIALAQDAKGGCSAIVWADKRKRVRVAMGGAHSGWKRLDYEVEVELFLAAKTRTAEEATVTMEAAVDALIDRIESDRTFDGRLWQAGEGSTGIDDEIGKPAVIGDVTNVWAFVRFNVTDWSQT